MELSIEQKRLAFLNETVDHFKKNKRALTTPQKEGWSGICKYSHDVNGGCAIGRKVSKELAEELSGIGAGVSRIDIFEKLPSELKELGQAFLIEVQVLHDFNRYWDDSDEGNQLTSAGVHMLYDIIAKYCGSQKI